MEKTFMTNQSILIYIKNMKKLENQQQHKVKIMTISVRILNQENFSETPAFRTKSTWNPPQGHPALEMFLSQMEADVFSLLPGNTTQYNLSKEEWKRKNI